MRKFLLYSSALAVFGLSSSVAEAACIQTPTCSSLGYTSTSSCTGGTKCPFGNYWNCDSVNKITELTNKITELEKIIEEIKQNSSSNSDILSNCKIGDILYSDMSCNTNVEASKTPIGVIFDATNKLAIGLVESRQYWSDSHLDVPGLSNITSSSAVIADWKGKKNTQIVLEYCSANGYSCPAFEYVNSYKTEGTQAGDWYLPAAAELSKSIVFNIDEVNKGLQNAGGDEIIYGEDYWSSTEAEKEGVGDYPYAWMVLGGRYKKSDMGGNWHQQRCVIAFNDNKDGSATICNKDYVFRCSGTGYTGGNGESCGGMYKSCSCASGYEWKNGVCEQAVVCEVGNILNSDMTCSASKVSGKTPIGVISYMNGSTRLAINLVNMKMPWGGDGTDISGLTNYSLSPHTTDFSGKSNTSKIVSVLGSSSTSYAAGYCYNFTTAGTSKGDWYLPAQGELYASIVTNYSAVNSGLSAAGGTSVSRYHWSSSEYSYLNAWNVDASGGVAGGLKGLSFYVRCVLAF